MACACSRHNMHSDWLILRHYSLFMGWLWACKSKAKNPFHNNFNFNLKCFIFNKRSQTPALPHWPNDAQGRSLFYIFSIKTSLAVNKYNVVSDSNWLHVIPKDTMQWFLGSVQLQTIWSWVQDTCLWCLPMHENTINEKKVQNLTLFSLPLRAVLLFVFPFQDWAVSDEKKDSYKYSSVTCCQQIVW